jgi:tetratricopeptide (TPR) repeat protein
VEKFIEVSVDRAVRGEQGGYRLRIEVTDPHTGTIESPEDSKDYALDPNRPFEDAARFASEFAGEYLSRYPRPGFPGIEGPTSLGPSYERYGEGALLLNRRTPRGLQGAREAFEDVLRQDPESPYAYSGLSKYYGLSNTYRYQTGVGGYENAGHALALARRAIELAPDLADGYAARSYVTRRSHAPVTEPEEACQAALRLDPGGAETLSWCGFTLLERGNDEAAYKATQQGVARDPLNAGRRMGLALLAIGFGDYGTAQTEARVAWELEPEMMKPRALEAWAMLLAGEAERCLERELGPHAVVRAACLHDLGRTDEATSIVDSVTAAIAAGSLSDDTFTEVVRTGDLAGYFARLGDLPETLRWIRRSFALSPSGIEDRFLESAIFDRVRGQTGFAEEVESIRAGIWEKAEAAGEAAYEELFGGLA